ncbi:MAG: hypothetical protein WBL93_13355 [Lutisporaceae bacterium]
MMKITGKKIIVIIIAIIVVYNLSWLSITTIKYNKYLKVIPKNQWGLHFIEKEDGYLYSVKRPSYLSFIGNLGVVDNKNGDALIIWPLISGGYIYGVRLQKDGTAYEIYVDENMEPIHKDNTYEAQIVNKYKTELKELLSKANEMWKLE